MKTRVNRVTNYIKTEWKKAIKLIALFLVFIYLWEGFEAQRQTLICEALLPLMNLPINWLGISIGTLAMGWLLYKLVIYFKNRGIASGYQILLLSGFVYGYIRCRLSGEYNYEPLVMSIAYLDIFALALLLLLVVYTVNILRCLFYVEEKAEENSFFADRPIDNKEEDILEFNSEACALVKRLYSLQLCKSWSIGITASWGSGKTSFINLIEKAIDPKKCIVVKFNPRGSKDFGSIQEDFFSVLCSALKPYNARFSTMFKDYMQALQLIDNRNIARTLLNLKEVVDRESEREKLETALRMLPKRIVVFIEDFDRLLAAEIIEVLKLIDSNASFPSLLFLTAFDKEYVTNALKDNYKGEETLFSDKFFNLEVSVPIRPYRKIFDYLCDKLMDRLKLTVTDKAFYRSILERHYHIIKTCLCNLRDVKRFLNLFLKDYENIKGEVVFEEYFLLTIIKYKDSNYHASLYKKIGLQTNLNRITQQKDISVEYKAILDILFPELTNDVFSIDETNDKEIFRSINNSNSFDNYFVNRLYDQLSQGVMGATLMKSIEQAKIDIAQWEEERLIHDFIEYISSKSIVSFDSKELFFKFVDIVFFLSMKHCNTELYWTVVQLLTKENIQEFAKYQNFEEQEYKERLLKNLKDGAPLYHHILIRKLILYFVDKKSKKEILFTKDELLNINKQSLNDFITYSDNQMNEQHMHMLYCCFKTIDQQTRKVTLDEECCLAVRKLIEKSPDYYVSSSVRLAGFSSDLNSNSITCEPFWEQIFGDGDAFYTFINNKQLDNVPKINGLRIFWEIYRNHEYKPIEIEDFGNVQTQINNGLANLKMAFDRLCDIENRFTKDKMSGDLTAEKCQHFLTKIKKNKLNINKTGRLQGKIMQENAKLIGINE